MELNKNKQDWRSPVYSGRFEYICWNSLYSSHFCIHCSSLFYSWVPTPNLLGSHHVICSLYFAHTWSPRTNNVIIKGVSQSESSTRRRRQKKPNHLHFKTRSLPARVTREWVRRPLWRGKQSTCFIQRKVRKRKLFGKKRFRTIHPFSFLIYF